VGYRAVVGYRAAVGYRATVGYRASVGYRARWDAKRDEMPWSGVPCRVGYHAGRVGYDANGMGWDWCGPILGEVRRRDGMRNGIGCHGVGYRAVWDTTPLWDTMPTGWDGCGPILGEVRRHAVHRFALDLVDDVPVLQVPAARLALTLRVCPQLVSASSTNSTAEYC
jgi:hypothetical protein